ncbi:hypothetical protein [Novosphingobium sp. FSW06-99]|uniref:hypothetical protein n=1 Tax=Novosphingobium sp. FSW06-99 TaxID=1739113 RepID=UPI00076BCDDC|nr:hypothetical protein [Novosphingobium sp. FSW06-99]KUR77656.1 hypothetical protein AQZ49_09115 [Novosphingobium sp. FSW06-99]
MTGVWHTAASALALIAAWNGGDAALAQSAGATPPLAYGNADAADSAATAPDGTTANAADNTVSGGDSDGNLADAHGPASGTAAVKPRKRTRIVPYLEVDQTIYDQTAPEQQTVTYTTLAAGADMLINSHSTTGVATIRYEHHFSETKAQGSSDTFTGIARTQTQIIPHTLQFDFGGLATHTAIAANGSTYLNPVDNVGSIYQIWSLYGGPSLQTHAGIVGIKAAYDVGYNEIDQIRSYVPSGGGAPVDIFGHSLTQQGTATVGVRPGEVAPFGLALLGNYLREDISNLDQRLIDARLGGQITQPITRDLALVGDLGWEKVQVSQRNAELDANGNPIVGSNGQYVTNPNSPRQLAYQTDGLTWDVGVVWKPSKRTMAAAYVGQRYDSTTYYGSFYHAPNSRSTLNVTVFDGVYGFGSGLMSTLQALPTDFSVTRDPFSGNVGGCYLGSTGGSCTTGALGSANAFIYRARGVNAAYALTLGRMNFSVGTGYVTRRFITADNSVLAADNGLLDRTWYIDSSLSGQIDRQTRFVISGFASLYRTDEPGFADSGDWGLNGMLVHHLTDHLVGTAAVEVLGIKQQLTPEQLETLGQLGLRYNFR